MPASRDVDPYRSPSPASGGVGDLSEVPAFLRRGRRPVPSRERPVAPDPVHLPAVPASIRSGRPVRGEARVATEGPVASIRSGRDLRPRSGADRPEARRSGTSRSPGPRPVRPDHRPVPAPGPVRPAGDAPALPIPSLSRRRLGTLAAALAGAWLVIAFGRQVGEASAASDRVEALQLGNDALRADVAALHSQLTSVTDSGYISQAARAVRMGGRGEIPFALAADAPSLAPDAPGSAVTRLGASEGEGSAMQGWIELLLGPRG
jgi:hypothetical protein